MHNYWIPVDFTFIVAGLIFGSHVYFEIWHDAHIAETTAERLGSQAPAEIPDLQRVRKGYGVCSDYALLRVEPGRFYYNSAIKWLALGTDVPLYQNNGKSFSC